MQDAAAEIIYKSLDEMGSRYSDTVVCDLLEIVETEMGYKAPDDPLGDRILWLAVQRLEKLQKFDRFASLLQEHQELAMHLCMRAGSKSWNNRRKSSGRFKQEGTVPALNADTSNQLNIRLKRTSKTKFL
ncbi:hypothetical protein RJ035_003799 [Blastomyces gilchristii]